MPFDRGQNDASVQQDKQRQEMEDALSNIPKETDPDLAPHGPSPSFHRLSEFFEKCMRSIKTSRKSRKVDKSALTRELFEAWREQVGNNLYPLVRLMLPERDIERRSYGVKEQVLAKCYLLAMGVEEKSSAGQELVNWKVPTAQDATGDFATVAYNLIEKRSTVTGNSHYTIQDVNKLLDRLANISRSAVRDDATGQRNKGGRPLMHQRAEVFRDAFHNLTALDQKWLIRIILKDLKIGVGERMIFPALHPDAQNMFNVCSDIKKTCLKLWNKLYRLPNESVNVQFGTPHVPMRCIRNQHNFASIIKAMKRHRIDKSSESPSGSQSKGKGREDPWYFAPDEFLIEEKLDGHRTLLHKRGNEYHYFTRNGNEHTGYGTDPSTGSITQFIHHLFIDTCEEVILDGEMVVWHPGLEKYVPFGKLMSYIDRVSFGATDPRPCFKVFDVVHYKKKGGSPLRLIPRTLSWRREMLSKIITPVKGILEIVEFEKARTEKDIKRFLGRVIEERGEGLVCKNPDASYLLDGRFETWIKVKPDFMDELGETLDLVVVGGYWGQGWRGGSHATFLCALRDDRNKLPDGRNQFVTLAKVGSGFSMDDFEEIKNKTAGKWFDAKDSDGRRIVPPWFRTLKEYPNQYIEPWNSFVLKVKAAEIVATEDYGANVCLRFPRCKRVRYDISWNESMSLQEFVAVQRRPAAKRGGGGAMNGDMSNARKKTTSSRYNIPHTVIKSAAKAQQQTKLFEGLTFYVATGSTNRDEAINKLNLERTVEEHGGKIVQQIPSGETGVVLSAPRREHLVRNLRGGADTDIVSASWAINSIAQEERLPLTSRYYLQASPQTQQSREYNRSPSPTTSATQGDVPNSSPSQRQVQAKYEEEELPANSQEEDSSSDATTTVDFSDPEVVDDVDDSAKITIKDIDDDGDGDEGLTNMIVKDLATTAPGTALSAAPPGMDDGGTAMELDSNRLFWPLVFYLDTSANAASTGLDVSTSADRQAKADRRLSQAAKEIEANGGRVVTSFEDDSLTHIVFDSAIQDRVKDMIRRTSQPRYRRVVSLQWVLDSVELTEVQDEEDYKF